MSSSIVYSENRFGVKCCAYGADFVLPYKALSLNMANIRTVDDAILMMTKIQRSSVYFTNSSLMVTSSLGDDSDIKDEGIYDIYNRIFRAFKIPNTRAATETFFDSVISYFSVPGKVLYWAYDPSMYAIASWFSINNKLTHKRLYTLLSLFYGQYKSTGYEPYVRVNGNFISELVMGCDTAGLAEVLEDELLILPKEFIDDIRIHILRYDEDDKHDRLKKYIKMRVVCQY